MAGGVLLLQSIATVVFAAAGHTNRHCTPLDHGAKADWQAIDTAAINAAISACGTVTFPPGRYLSGTIRLQNDTRLALENALVLAAPTGHYDLAEPPPSAALACVIPGAPYAPECQDYGH